MKKEKRVAKPTDDADSAEEDAEDKSGKTEQAANTRSKKRPNEEDDTEEEKEESEEEGEEDADEKGTSKSKKDTDKDRKKDDAGNGDVGSKKTPPHPVLRLKTSFSDLARTLQGLPVDKATQGKIMESMRNMVQSIKAAGEEQVGEIRRTLLSYEIFDPARVSQASMQELLLLQRMVNVNMLSASKSKSHDGAGQTDTGDTKQTKSEANPILTKRLPKEPTDKTSKKRAKTEESPAPAPRPSFDISALQRMLDDNQLFM